MSETVKSRIYEMINEIEDENILYQVMEDLQFYVNKKDITDNLTSQQLKELEIAIKEVENNDTVSWDDFKKEMNEWRIR